MPMFTATPTAPTANHHKSYTFPAEEKSMASVAAFLEKQAQLQREEQQQYPEDVCVSVSVFPAADDADDDASQTHTATTKTQHRRRASPFVRSLHLLRARILPAAGSAAFPSHHLQLIVATYARIFLWMSLSIALILFNKYLLAYTPFRFPLALTLWHMVFCSAVASVLIHVFRVTPTIPRMNGHTYATRVLPIGALYAASLAMSNTAYLSLSVSFIQMTKSLMPGLVYLVACGFGREAFRGTTLATMAMIAFGVGVSAYGELAFDARGTTFQLAALAVEATRLVLVQVLIDGQLGTKMNSMQSLYYISPACALFLAPACVLHEFPLLRAAAPALAARGLVPLLVINACVAFALNLAVFLLIGRSSALTMNVAGVVKDWILIGTSPVLFGSPVTAINTVGYALALAGVGLYQKGKLDALVAGGANPTTSSGAGK